MRRTVRTPLTVTLLALSMAPSAFAQNAPSPAASAPTPGVLVGVDRPRGRAAVHLLDATGTLRPLRLEVDAQTTESSDTGTGSPTLSPDGTWVAYTRNRVPYVRRATGGPELRVMPPGRARAAEVTFVAWSPDSARVLFHLHGESSLDGPEPILPSPAGFYAFEPATQRRVAFHGSVAAAWGWADNSTLYGATDREGTRSFVRASLDGSAPAVLFASPISSSPLVFTVRNGRVVQLSGTAGANANDSRVEVRNTDGTGLHDVSPRAGWATYQQPRLSPDGATVIFTRESRTSAPGSLDLVPATVGAPRALTACAQCRYAWITPTTIAMLSHNTLTRLALDGTSSPVTTQGTLRVWW